MRFLLCVVSVFILSILLVPTKLTYTSTKTAPYDIEVFASWQYVGTYVEDLTPLAKSYETQGYELIIPIKHSNKPEFIHSLWVNSDRTINAFWTFNLNTQRLISVCLFFETEEGYDEYLDWFSKQPVIVMEHPTHERANADLLIVRNKYFEDDDDAEPVWMVQARSEKLIQVVTPDDDWFSKE